MDSIHENRVYAVKCPSTPPRSREGGCTPSHDTVVLKNPPLPLGNIHKAESLTAKQTHCQNPCCKYGLQRGLHVLVRPGGSSAPRSCDNSSHGACKPPPPCISYAKVPNECAPYAYCSLDKAVADAQHIPPLTQRLGLTLQHVHVPCVVHGLCGPGVGRRGAWRHNRYHTPNVL